MTNAPDGGTPEPTQPYGWQPPAPPPPPPPPPAGLLPYQQPHPGDDHATGGYPSGARPAYGPPAPFGWHPVSGVPYSDKSKATAGLLQLLLPFVSVCGVGRLYAGHTGIGLIQLIGVFVSWVLSFVLIGIPFLIGFWLWSVIDGIVILAGDSKDGHGRLLR